MTSICFRAVCASALPINSNDFWLAATTKDTPQVALWRSYTETVIWLDQGGRQRDLQIIDPPAGLSESVEHFWVHGPFPDPLWRIVPDLSPHIIFRTALGKQGFTAACRLVGARSKFVDLDVGDRTLTVGARLRPGALPYLLRQSTRQLTDQSVLLDNVFGHEAVRLVEQMALSPQQAVHLLGEFIKQRVREIPLFPTELAHCASVVDMAKASGLSRRAAYDRTVYYLGLTPSAAMRIQRLQNGLASLNRGVSLAEAAAAAGYSDQSHFTREAADLLGEPPGAWRRRAAQSFKTRG